MYKNPHTGELVETKGGNHKTLKEWKAEHGSAAVESWLTEFVLYKRPSEGLFIARVKRELATRITVLENL